MSSLRNKVSVLLIEDNEVDVMGVKRAFSQSKLDNPIIVASDGREALEKLRDGKSVNKPYLVLLDLNMPRMNGIEFLQEARKDPALRSAIIFVLTTSNTPEDKNKAYSHSIAGYMVKNSTQGGFIDAASMLNHYASLIEFP